MMYLETIDISRRLQKDTRMNRILEAPYKNKLATEQQLRRFFDSLVQRISLRTGNGNNTLDMGMPFDSGQTLVL